MFATALSEANEQLDKLCNEVKLFSRSNSQGFEVLNQDIRIVLDNFNAVRTECTELLESLKDEEAVLSRSENRIQQRKEFQQRNAKAYEEEYSDLSKELAIRKEEIASLKEDYLAVQEQKDFNTLDDQLLTQLRTMEDLLGFSLKRNGNMSLTFHFKDNNFSFDLTIKNREYHILQTNDDQVCLDLLLMQLNSSNNLIEFLNNVRQICTGSW
ncbi:hypothetical protein PCE1_004416 [Barthelona sp. PCE]